MANGNAVGHVYTVAPHVREPLVISHTASAPPPTMPSHPVRATAWSAPRVPLSDSEGARCWQGTWPRRRLR